MVSSLLAVYGDPDGWLVMREGTTGSPIWKNKEQRLEMSANHEVLGQRTWRYT